MSTNNEATDFQGLVCPAPLLPQDHIEMAHGSGGRLMQGLIRQRFLPAFENSALSAGNDGALVAVTQCGRLVVSTDAHVVSPLFFPGGDIGRLAVCGTVNDVAMMGARPLFLTASFIIEEGLPIETLQMVLASMSAASLEAGVQIVAGDTKVVQKGCADGLFISTTGIGALLVNPDEIGGANARPGDAVLLSGSIGDHGIAVLAARGDLGFEAGVASDVAPLNSLVERTLETSEQVHVMRDPTRGGLATTLNEIAAQSNVGIVIREEAIPVRPAVQAACEMLGFDPLYIANEGKAVVIVAAEDAPAILETMRAHPLGGGAVLIGEVVAEPPGRVLMQTRIGTHRVVDSLSGELLPRIC
ncbi:MAG: hydrogenase expression/formation protein HypE [Chloroflexi bacterium]|nr:hydrogenase expression/formation protein HypE [Chloroflexota bacterium]